VAGTSTGAGGGTSGGVAGLAGSAGMVALGGAAGATAFGGMAGTAVDGSAGKSLGTPDICTFQIDATPSDTIPTVGIVNWTTDLAGLTSASIEFTLDDPTPDTINTGSGGDIDVSGTTHRALLLGLKAQRSYTYRIVAKSGTTSCTSADQTFVTGAATNAPSVTRTVMNAAEEARGFIVTSGGYRAGGGFLDAYIVDSDGDVVWWAASPPDCSRALMDWDGQNMWMVDTNPSGGVGTVSTIAMDGTGAQNIADVTHAHHDLAVLPGGVVAFLVWVGTGNTASTLVERSPDGTLTTVATLDATVFDMPANGVEYHANSVQYHPSDDTYTVSDLYAAAYAKLSRQGELLWQFRADCTGSTAPKCAEGALAGNHGHHFLDDGHFLFFNANLGDPSPVNEYTLSETASSLGAAQIWTYTYPGLNSDVLGDVQRLPNGNTLVDYCHHGMILEVSPSGDLVQSLKASAPADELPTGNYPPPDSVYFAFGYLNFRESLYGAPIR
jgi:hypothetical protein